MPPRFKGPGNSSSHMNNPGTGDGLASARRAVKSLDLARIGARIANERFHLAPEKGCRSADERKAEDASPPPATPAAPISQPAPMPVIQPEPCKVISEIPPPIQSAPGCEPEPEVKSLVDWYLATKKPEGGAIWKGRLVIPAKCDAEILMPLMRLGEIMGRADAPDIADAARMAISDIKTARALSKCFDERMKDGDGDKLPLLSYEFARMLQIRSQSASTDSFSLALELISESEGESLKKAEEKRKVPDISETLPLRQMLGKMRQLARVINASNPGNLGNLECSYDGWLEENEEQELLARFSREPLASLANIRNAIAVIDDPLLRKEYIRASIALELTLDCALFQPDNITRSGMPQYIMHGFYDFGSKIDFRERLKADKFMFAHHLVELKALALDYIISESNGNSLENKKKLVSFLAKEVRRRVSETNIEDDEEDDKEAKERLNERTVVMNAYFEEDRKGVCRHNALILALFLQEFGIRNWLLKGTVLGRGRHAINAMRLDKQWHVVDATQKMFEPVKMDENLDNIDLEKLDIFIVISIGIFQTDMIKNKWAIKQSHIMPIESK